MSIHSERKFCSDIDRVLVLNDPPARSWPNLNENIAQFANARPPGIYKPDYVRELFEAGGVLRNSTRPTLNPLLLLLLRAYV